MVVAPDGWVIMERPSNNGWFRGTTIFGNLHVTGNVNILCDYTYIIYVYIYIKCWVEDLNTILQYN